MIIEYENTLRRLINQVIGSKDESNFKVTEERILKWKEKRETEKKKYNGVLLEDRIIYYSDFYDLETIIIKNWDLFSPILINKKRFEIFFSEIEDYRNTFAHGRSLMLSQELLIEGITKDLKNLITIYYNRNKMKEDFFIEIIKISDSLGNIWRDKIEPQTEPILRVGDDYEVLVEANDPKDRAIEYKIFKCGGEGHFEIIQESSRFVFRITEELIGRHVSFLVIAFTPDSEYENSDSILISMSIIPQE
ncbi:MAG: hypothetical protein JXQ69_06885 [Paludibacteraceae bacterium]|nr:hypothetical protein [Paludibacteraceae bacterium]